ncbi:hypothetical protein V6N13_141996 [Hibiscus sabdariffa]|uniref:Uncharacterized protein n=1 Tax=Hibiscus sabdariffa TaxID=183260 RepID=A0ABR2FCW4_9ROSI
MRLFTLHGRDINLCCDDVLTTKFNNKLIEYFYNGLNATTKHLVDGSSNGPLLDYTYNSDVGVLEKFPWNYSQYPISRAASCMSAPGVFELDEFTALKAQISSLENKLKNLEGTSEVTPIQLAQKTATHRFSCEICGDNHSYEDCLQHVKNPNYVNNM